MPQKINGFEFSIIGELVNEPEQPTMELLEDTLNQLLAKRQFISASRIQHRINTILFEQGVITG